MIYLAGTLVLLILFLAFFSGAEAAILAANRLRARHRAEQGEAGAKAVVHLHGTRENFLPAILAVETLLTVACGSLGTVLALQLDPEGRGWTVSAVAFGISGLVLFFGEILPKSIATSRPDRFAYLVAPVVLFCTRIFSVLLHPLTWVLRKILSLFPHDPHHPIPTLKELKYLITLSREHGILQESEEELLQNIFEFADAKVGEIMVPRTHVESLEAEATVPELLDKFVKTRLTRFPVHAKDLDHVLGFVDVLDILVPLANEPKEARLDLLTFIRPAVFVPESKRVGSLLHEMQKDSFSLAIVIDEYGGTAGLVSLTDLLEAIVGKLEERTAAPEIHPIDEKTLIVPSSTRLEEIEERLGLSFEVSEYQTVGGLVFGLFGRVPEQGEQIRYQNLKFTVTEKDGYKINKVMVTKEAR